MKSEDIDSLISRMNSEVTKEKDTALSSITKLKQKQEIQKSDITADLMELKRRSKILSTLIKKVDSKLSSSKKEIKELSARKQRKNSFKNKLTREIQSLTGIEKQVVDLKKKVGALKIRKIALQSKKDRLSAKVSKLREKLKMLMDFLSELNKELKPIKKKLNSSEKKKKERKLNKIKLDKLIENLAEVEAKLKDISRKEDNLKIKDKKLNLLLKQLRTMHQIKRIEEKQLHSALTKLNEEERKIKKIFI